MSEDFDPFLICGPGDRKRLKTNISIRHVKKYKPETKAMTKYFKRGTREYYQVTPERVIRIVNAFLHSYVTVAMDEDLPENVGTVKRFLEENAKEGILISKEEFKAQFDDAVKLIVLD